MKNIIFDITIFYKTRNLTNQKQFSAAIAKLFFLVGAMISISCFAQQDAETNANPAEWSEEWSAEFPVGSKMIEIQTLDQTGRSVNLTELSGDQGYLLLMNRSVVW